jgi:hypothetical protein
VAAGGWLLICSLFHRLICRAAAGRPLPLLAAATIGLRGCGHGSTGTALGPMISLLLSLSLPCFGAGSTSPPIPPDPVGHYDFPDPAATYSEGTFHAFGGRYTRRDCFPCNKAHLCASCKGWWL